MYNMIKDLNKQLPKNNAMKKTKATSNDFK